MDASILSNSEVAHWLVAIRSWEDFRGRLSLRDGFYECLPHDKPVGEVTLDIIRAAVEEALGDHPAPPATRTALAIAIDQRRQRRVPLVALVDSIDRKTAGLMDAIQVRRQASSRPISTEPLQCIAALQHHALWNEIGSAISQLGLDPPSLASSSPGSDHPLARLHPQPDLSSGPLFVLRRYNEMLRLVASIDDELYTKKNNLGAAHQRESDEAAYVAAEMDQLAFFVEYAAEVVFRRASDITASGPFDFRLLRTEHPAVLEAKRLKVRFGEAGPHHLLTLFAADAECSLVGENQRLRCEWNARTGADAAARVCEVATPLRVRLPSTDNGDSVSVVEP